ncbi:MarP family serine protease [Nocardia sp. NPDC058058]|uniref:MarP family serine protease n=1 Tax=Nocardia sp. NPDC058058 TaxID=3346317 RepID=UPI0036DA04E8
MTLSNVLDLLVLAAMLFAALQGYRRGVLTALLGFTGVLGGVWFGAQLIDAVRPYLPLGPVGWVLMVTAIVAAVVGGQFGGEWLARRLLRIDRARRFRRIDALAGGFCQALAVPVAVWLLATAVAVTAGANIVAVLDDSKTVRTMDAVAPYWLVDMSRTLASPLRDLGPVLDDEWSTPPADPNLVPDAPIPAAPAAATAQRSVLRIAGTAVGCGRLSGTGFVIAPERVLTNAHVVAGMSEVSVQEAGRGLRATVVAFDSVNDLAVLAVPGLSAPPMVLAAAPADPGAGVMVLGYPGGGWYTAAAGRVLARSVRQVPDLYHAVVSSRWIYQVSGALREGDSGGPLVDSQGRVLGIVFAADSDARDIGYAMDVRRALGQLGGDSLRSSHSVPTGPCRL